MNKKLAKFYTAAIITYWIVIIAVILSMIPLYNSYYDTTIESDIRFLSGNIQMGFSRLEKALEQTATSAQSISIDKSILTLAKDKDSSNRIASHLYDVYSNSSRKLWNTFSNTKSVMVQFARNNAIVTSNAVYADKAFFYDHFFTLSDLNYDDWQDMIWNNHISAYGPVHPCDNRTDGDAFIMLNYYYPSNRSPSFVITYVFSCEELLNEVLTEETARFGKTVLSFSTSADTLQVVHDSCYQNNEEITVCRKESTLLSLAVTLSGDGFSNSVARIRSVITLYIVIAISSAILLSALLVYLLFKPLRTISHNLNEEEANSSGSIFSAILTAINTANEKQKKIEDSLICISDELTQALIHLCVIGSDVDIHTLNKNVPLLSQGYMVCAISVNELSTFDRAQLSAHLPIRFPGCLIINDAPLFAILPSTYDSAEVADAIQSLFSTVVFNSSDVYHGADELHTAAEQALNGLQKGPVPVNTEHSEAMFNSERYRLLLESSSTAMLDHFFDSLNGLDNPDDVRNVIENAQSILQERLPDTAFADYDSTMTPQENMAALKEETKQATQKVLQQCLSDQEKTVCMALDFINDHMSSPLLCLTQVAEYCHISEKQLYILISKKTGMNYIDYVTSIRIEEAKRLLANTEISIKKISACVGYDNPNSFYKLFKKKEKLSPTEYRAAKS